MASLAGVRQVVTYEAQAAIELESLIDEYRVPAAGAYQFAISSDGSGGWLVDAAPVIAAVAADVRGGTPVNAMAAHFHMAVAELMAALASAVRRETGLTRVALSGGVFQNVTLVRLAEERLEAAGFVGAASSCCSAK